MKKEKWDADAKKQVATDEDEQVNRASALWTRPKSEISEEQYDEFYKHVAHDFEPPLAFVHAKVEGRQEYTQLLYVPQRAPFDLWDREHRRGVKLYVRRVFIMDDAEQLMPAYLRFVRGVVDSNDLPLNVSREILQQSRDVAGHPRRGRQAGARRCSRSWPRSSPTSTRPSGPSSAGCSRKASPRIRRTRSGSRSCCASPRRTTDADAQTVSLADYVGRMKEGQDAIYYVTADSYAAAKNSPHLEMFRKNGIEVLLLHDRVDEWVVSSLSEFDGKPLQSVAKGDLDLSKLGARRRSRRKRSRPTSTSDLSTHAEGAAGPCQQRAHHAPADRFTGLPVATSSG